MQHWEDGANTAGCRAELATWDAAAGGTRSQSHGSRAEAAKRSEVPSILGRAEKAAFSILPSGGTGRVRMCGGYRGGGRNAVSKLNGTEEH